MLKRLFVWAIAVVFVAAAGSLVLADNKGSTHNGQVLGVDKEAKTITIKVKEQDGGGKDTIVYHVTAKTVFLDQNDAPITFDDVKAGMKVRIRSLQKEGQKQLLELEVRPDKE